MSPKRHYPPSRLRYEEAHPTISVRVSRELYDELRDLKATTGKSLGDILREALGLQQFLANQAYNRGFEKAERHYRIDYRCSVCGGTVTLVSENEKQAARGYMREHGWAHASCIRQGR